MPYADLEHRRVYYTVDGSETLPVLILSHSLGVDLSMWQPQVDTLGARLLRYDTRGHGASTRSEGPYNIPELGQDVVDLANALGVEKFSFCGLSMGGVIGQWLGIHASDRLQKLVLANTAAKIGTYDNWNARIETVRQQGLESIIPGTLERWFTADFCSSHPEQVRQTEALLRAASPAGYVACCAAIRDTDFRGELAKIRVPTLVICGKQDPVTPPADAEFLAKNIPAATLVQLDAAHLSNIEAAEKFNQILRAWLSH